MYGSSKADMICGLLCSSLKLCESKGALFTCHLKLLCTWLHTQHGRCMVHHIIFATLLPACMSRKLMSRTSFCTGTVLNKVCC